MKKIFITGGNGFIGKNFIEYAYGKYELIHPSHRELDLLDENAVDSFFNNNQIDVVLHCANIGGLRSNLHLEKVVQNNLRIFFNIIKNKKKFKKMIHLGSGAEYDKLKDIKKIKETDFGKSIPQDDYGFYKYVCSKYIENTENIYCLRLFGVFGKYEDFKIKFISNLIIRYLIKEPLLMIQNTYFDFLDVCDLSKIIDYFINNNPKYQFYNIGAGVRYELLSIAKRINLLNNYSLNIVVQKQGFNKEYTCNNDRLLSEIKGLKITPLSLSIINLYNYYKENRRKLDISKAILDQYNKI